MSDETDEPIEPAVLRTCSTTRLITLGFDAGFFGAGFLAMGFAGAGFRAAMDLAGALRAFTLRLAAPLRAPMLRFAGFAFRLPALLRFFELFFADERRDDDPPRFFELLARELDELRFLEDFEDFRDADRFFDAAIRDLLFKKVSLSERRTCNLRTSCSKNNLDEHARIVTFTTAIARDPHRRGGGVHRHRGLVHLPFHRQSSDLARAGRRPMARADDDSLGRRR